MDFSHENKNTIKLMLSEIEIRWMLRILKYKLNWWKIMLPSIKQKLDTCKELFLRVGPYSFNENSKSLAEIEIGLMEGILAKYMLNWWK